MSKKEDRTAFDNLIPELKLWNHGKGVDPEAWICMMGRYDLAIGYSLIFWPQFVEFEGYILRKGFAINSLRGFQTQTSNNSVAVEAVMNHLHMADIHGNGEPPNEEQLRYLGRTLFDIHKLKLAAEYPERKFEIVFNDDPGLEPLDYELTFWQVD